jgi:hypothetical protein
MDSIGDVLGKYKIEQPDEVTAIKDYIAKEFNVDASVAVQANSLIISVQSASLANTLRLRTPALQKIANTSKRLQFRIG